MYSAIAIWKQLAAKLEIQVTLASIYFQHLNGFITRNGVWYSDTNHNHKYVQRPIAQPQSSE